jgi:hypothetical protein
MQWGRTGTIDPKCKFYTAEMRECRANRRRVAHTNESRHTSTVGQIRVHVLDTHTCRADGRDHRLIASRTAKPSSDPVPEIIVGHIKKQNIGQQFAREK